MEKKYSLLEVSKAIFLVLVGFGLLVFFVSFSIALVKNFAKVLAGFTIFIGLLTSIFLSLLAILMCLWLSIKIKDIFEEKRNNLLLPIFAIISGLLVSFGKEYYPSEFPYFGILFSGCVSLMFFIGGIMWKQKKYQFKYLNTKVISITLFLLPIIVIFFGYSSTISEDISFSFSNVPLKLVLLSSLLLILTIASIIITYETR